jgi:hypothetical protein
MHGHVSPSAAIHDLLALVALGIVIAGARRFAGERRARLARRAIERRHRCPGCGYDITGIVGICPECGGTLVLET